MCSWFTPPPQSFFLLHPSNCATWNHQGFVCFFNKSINKSLRPNYCILSSGSIWWQLFARAQPRECSTLQKCGEFSFFLPLFAHFKLISHLHNIHKSLLSYKHLSLSATRDKCLPCLREPVTEKARASSSSEPAMLQLHVKEPKVNPQINPCYFKVQMGWEIL